MRRRRGGRCGRRDRSRLCAASGASALLHQGRLRAGLWTRRTLKGKARSSRALNPPAGASRWFR
jgi:hypothetical protein